MKTIIVTGGHSGIGLKLTKRLVADGHRVGLVVRDTARASSVSDVESVFVADLSDQDQVRTVAQEIRHKWGLVDILFNNAGVLLDDVYKSPECNEMHLEVNALSVSAPARFAVGAQ